MNIRFVFYKSKRICIWFPHFNPKLGLLEQVSNQLLCCLFSTLMFRTSMLLASSGAIDISTKLYNTSVYLLTSTVHVTLRHSEDISLTCPLQCIRYISYINSYVCCIITPYIKGYCPPSIAVNNPRKTGTVTSVRVYTCNFKTIYCLPHCD